MSTLWGDVGGQKYVPLAAVDKLFSPPPKAIGKTSQPTGLTQTSAIKQLIGVFNEVPSWPAKMQSYIGGGIGGWWGAKSAMPVKDWTGLKSVFPGQPQSMWATGLGMVAKNPNGSVTADQVAHWVLNWEEVARQINLKTEPYQGNQFALVQLFSFFYGTDIKNPRSIVSQKDMMAIRNNVIEVNRGWRVLGTNKVETLVPMIRDISGLMAIANPSFLAGFFTRANWAQQVYAPYIREQDSMTLTFLPGNRVIYNRNAGVNGMVLGLGYSWIKNFGPQLGENSLSFVDSGKKAAIQRAIPAIISPHDPMQPYPYLYEGVIKPAPAQNVLYTNEFVVNNQTWPTGNGIVKTLPYEIGYKNNGTIQWVAVATNMPNNYPAQDERYGGLFI